MIDYKWKSFLTVVEEGTLAKAGEKLGLTQPAISQHLKGLEEHYGQPLFNHKGRTLVLNEVGTIVKEQALIAEIAEKRALKQMESLLSGRSKYCIGATLTVGEFILPSYVGRYYQAYRNRDVTISIANTVSILEQLKRGKIDLALIEGPFNRKEFKQTHFMTDEMIFIASKETLPLHIPYIDEDTLSHNRLILREIGSGTRYYWDEYEKEKHLTVLGDEQIIEVGSLSAIKSLVEAGYGCSIMSKKAVEKELSLGSIVTKPFKWGPLMREIYFVYTKESPSAFIEEFIRFCT
mgnify:CR=1 FL=1